VRKALKRDLEATRFAADRAFRQYDATDPANRLVAGELDARGNTALARVTEVEGKIELPVLGKRRAKIIGLESTRQLGALRRREYARFLPGSV
jgi:hypothetical protein